MDGLTKYSRSKLLRQKSSSHQSGEEKSITNTTIHQPTQSPSQQQSHNISPPIHISPYSSLTLTSGEERQK